MSSILAVTPVWPSELFSATKSLLILCLGGEGGNGRRGRGKQKNTNGGLMGVDHGRGDWLLEWRGWGWGEQWGKRQDNCNWTINKKERYLIVAQKKYDKTKEKGVGVSLILLEEPGSYLYLVNNNTRIKSVFCILTTVNLLLPHPIFYITSILYIYIYTHIYVYDILYKTSYFGLSGSSYISRVGAE